MAEGRTALSECLCSNKASRAGKWQHETRRSARCLITALELLYVEFFAA